MCGIAGIVAPEVKRYREPLGRMTDSLAHRGPDGAGIHFFGECAFGHRRLSIVDLESGQQPMLSSDAALGITFNGEIYGYGALRKGLEGRYPFRTSSDTEVILALYESMGSDLLSRLPGMFAFALWDDRHHELFCARDRFGEKPLYYAIGPDSEFIFASEIKAIIASGLIRPRIDKTSLAHYLQHLYVPVDRTIYDNIHTLPPAHFLLWRNGIVTVRRYWDFPAPDTSITLDEAVERFNFMMAEAVNSQLVADVEVGAFLSGGLDSSTIVALASERKTNIKTFAFGFGPAINELPYAREIANRYRTDHIEIVDSDFDLADLMFEMSTCYDEPFADSSNIPTFLMCRNAAKNLKVVLSGDGGDELLGGYDFWYRPLHWSQKTESSDVWKMRLAALICVFWEKLSPPPKNLRYMRDGYRLKQFGPPAIAHERQNIFFNDLELSRFGLSCPHPGAPMLYGGIDDAFRMDLADYLPGDILVKTDRAAMANGLELRAPFLDVDVASFLISLPYTLKIDDVIDKKILRQAYADRWTSSIRCRSKQGFGAPVSVWLRQNALKVLAHDYLLSSGSKLSAFFDNKWLETVAVNNDYRTWIMLVLGIWMENHEFEGYS